MKTIIHSVSRQSIAGLTKCGNFLHTLKKEQPGFNHETVNTDWQYGHKDGKSQSWNDWHKVNCQICIDNNTPGSTLYKIKPVMGALRRPLPINDRFAAAIADAMRQTDRDRRNGRNDYSLAAAMTALMEKMDIHLGKSKCDNCGGSGKVAHQHGPFCYRETWGGDELVCGGGSVDCTSCFGTGFLSEDIFKND